MSTLLEQKSLRSHSLYKDAKVASCSSVLVKNGQAVAVAFKVSPRPLDFGHDRSSERASLSQ